MKHEQPDWLEQAEAGRYGYGRIEVDGQDGLLFEFVGSEGGQQGGGEGWNGGIREACLSLSGWKVRRGTGRPAV
jgi:hypothetical protein